MGYPVVHFEIIGKDTAKLHGYYGELFGWQIDKPFPFYGTVAAETSDDGQRPGIGGGIGGPPPGEEGCVDGGGHVTFYVEVPDAEAALAQAEQLGGKRVMGPGEVPGQGIVIGHFTDPEGHLVGVVQEQG